MGIKTLFMRFGGQEFADSEKPPHHMGIKTTVHISTIHHLKTLKNLPTTWGLRRSKSDLIPRASSSEKPPHHMGIKTLDTHPASKVLVL